MHFCLYSLSEHQGAKLNIQKSEKRQCKVVPATLIPVT